MTITIRLATPDDDPAVAAILTAANPRQPVSVQQIQASRAKTLNSPLGLHLSQWLAEVDGVPAGFLGIAQWAGWYHPDRYMLQLMVAPAFARQGVGTRLAEVAEKHLRGRSARELFAWAYEDAPHAIQMLEKRGFAESARESESVLNVVEFNWADWESKFSLPAGYSRLTYPQFAEQYGEQHALQAFADAFNGGRMNMPSSIAPRLYTLEEVQEYLRHPSFFPDGIQLAVTQAGEVAALSELWLDLTDSSVLHTGLTATGRDHRRQGLALALKLAGIRAAQERGVSRMNTSNDSQNTGMLSINRALGFVAFPALIELKWGGV